MLYFNIFINPGKSTCIVHYKKIINIIVILFEYSLFKGRFSRQEEKKNTKYYT